MIFRKRSTPKTTIFPSRAGAKGLPALVALAGAVFLWAVPAGVLAQEPDEGDPATALFRRPRVLAAPHAFRMYQETRPVAVAASEFYSAGFLTEEREVPLGVLLGPLTPEQISTRSSRTALQRFTRVVLTPPDGVSYTEGDSVLVVERREAPRGYGSLLVPTGLVRIQRQDAGQAVGEIVAVYGPIRTGQLVTARPRFNDPGRVEPQAVEPGVEGSLLMARDPRELRLPQQVLFIDVGRTDGVGLGDVFEARSTAGEKDPSGLLAADQVLATLRVVHLGEFTAAVKVDHVLTAQLLPGTRVRQVAKLGQ